QQRRWSDPESADDLGALDADAIAAVAGEAWPLVRDADEMHEAVLALACITQAEVAANQGWSGWLTQLAKAHRVACLHLDGQPALWLAAERLQQFRALFADAVLRPAITAPEGFTAEWAVETALLEVVRARLGGFAPLTLAKLAADLHQSPVDLSFALA